MQYSECYVNSIDGTQLFFRCWQPQQGPVKAVINFVHGFGEHSGRYAHWGANFVQHGIAMTAIDYRGHGKAGGKRGHTESMKRLMDDVQTLVDRTKTLFPDVPHFLYGHSMGGNMVLNYHLRRERNFFKGIISSSPWLKLAFDANIFQVIMAKALVAIFPRIVTKTNLVVEMISHDPAVQQAYKNDPLVHGFISLKLYNVITNGGLYVLKNYSKIQTPTLLQHGTADQITSYKASMFLGYKARNIIHFHSWPGLYHELHNEFEKDDVFKYVHGWIKQQLQRP